MPGGVKKEGEKRRSLRLLTLRTEGALARRACRVQKTIIIPLTVKEILDEQMACKLA